jgi:hypothetical protein
MYAATGTGHRWRTPSGINASFRIRLLLFVQSPQSMAGGAFREMQHVDALFGCVYGKKRYAFN